MKNRNSLWENIYNKTSIEVEIILDGLGWDEACEKEKEFIKIYGKIPNGTLANFTDGGDGILGLKRDKKFCERNSQIHKGKIVSEESKKKMSISHRGKILSEEHKIRISEVISGRKLSEIHKERIGKANKSIKHGLWKGYIYQYDKYNNLIQIFETLSQASKETNVNFRDISKVCCYYDSIDKNEPYSYSKKHKSAGGFIWRRKNSKNED